MLAERLHVIGSSSSRSREVTCCSQDDGHIEGVTVKYRWIIKNKTNWIFESTAVTPIAFFKIVWWVETAGTSVCSSYLSVNVDTTTVLNFDKTGLCADVTNYYMAYLEN